MHRPPRLAASSVVVAARQSRAYFETSIENEPLAASAALPALRTNAGRRSRALNGRPIDARAERARLVFPARSAPHFGPTALSVMGNGLDVVVVGVQDKGAVVASVVDGPLTGRAVVSVAGGERDTVELVDGGVVGHGERDVDVLRSRQAVADER